jgi:hypothetical protein
MQFLVILVSLLIFITTASAFNEQEINAYEILGVSCRASQDEIKMAYRRLVKDWHPDKNSSSEALKKIILINLAYEKLKEPNRKKSAKQEKTKNKPKDQAQNKQNNDDEKSKDESKFYSFFREIEMWIIENFGGFGVYYLPTNIIELYEFIAQMSSSYWFRCWSFYEEHKFDHFLKDYEDWIMHNLAGEGIKGVPTTLHELYQFVQKLGSSYLAKRLMDILVKHLRLIGSAALQAVELVVRGVGALVNTLLA